MTALITNDYFSQQTTTLGLKSSFSPQADVLTTLIEEASEWVEKYTHRKFGAQSLVEQIRGSRRALGDGGWPYPAMLTATAKNAGRNLMVGYWPVDAVQSITWEDDFGNSGTVDPATYRVHLDTGILEMKNVENVWYKERLYTVTYTLPDPVPGPVKRATALKVVDLLDPQYMPGKTKNVELISNVEEQIITLLEPYRRERIG